MIQLLRTLNLSLRLKKVFPLISMMIFRLGVLLLCLFFIPNFAASQSSPSKDSSESSSLMMLKESIESEKENIKNLSEQKNRDLFYRNTNPFQKDGYQNLSKSWTTLIQQGTIFFQ